MKKDKVVFRQFPEGDIIALFPNDKADLNGNITSYMHIGQHSAASPELIDELKPVGRSQAKERRELIQELISIGYNL